MTTFTLPKEFFNISSLFIKSTDPAPHSSRSSILRWTDHLQQESSKSALPTPQYTTVQLFILQSYVFASFFPSKSSLSFKLGQGSYALFGTARNQSFSEGEDIHLHYICLVGPQCTKTRKISLNSSSRFFFLPDYQLLPRV